LPFPKDDKSSLEPTDPIVERTRLKPNHLEREFKVIHNETVDEG